MKTFDLDKDLSGSQVIVVNPALEFQRIVPWEDAMSKIVGGSAYMLLPREDGSVIRSAFLTLPKPLVIAEKRYYHVSVDEMTMDDPATRSMILARDDWTCAYCGEFGDTIDHIHPKARGGGNTWGNMTACCSPCNGAKSDHTPEEMGWARPSIPKSRVTRRQKAIQTAINERLGAMVG